jgi:hypothetical protein
MLKRHSLSFVPNGQVHDYFKGRFEKEVQRSSKISPEYEQFI